MKYFFTYLLVVVYVTNIFAQSNNVVHGINKQHIAVLSQLLKQNEQLLSQKTTSQRTTSSTDSAQRVIAQSTRDSTTALTDSIKLSYLGTAYSSQYDYNDMVYPYNYPYNTTPMFNFKGSFTKPQVLFDTFMHWTIDPFTLSYQYYETWYAGYSATNKNLTSFSQVYTDSTINQNMNFVNTFNGLNNITAGYRSNETGGASDSTFIQYFSYNTTNNLIEDSVFEYHHGAWHIVSKTYYTYNGLGELSQIDCYANDTDTTFAPVFPEQTQYVNTYDGSNRLITVSTNVNNGTSLQAFARDTFGYTGASTFHTYWVEWDYDLINGFWTPYYKMTKQLNASSLPDTVTTQTWDSVANAWMPQFRYTVTYNSYNNPDTLREYDYNYTYYPDTASYVTVYYYDLYMLPTATPIVSKVRDVVIYPNPTGNVLNISIDGMPASSEIMVSLINSMGQIVRMEKMPILYGKGAIATSDLIPGIYAVTISDSGGNMMHKQSFVKE